jgi:hypothetical protein
MTCFSFPWANHERKREQQSNDCGSAFHNFSSMIVVRWWFWCLIAGLAFVQELLFVLFLLCLSRALRIKRFHLTFLRWRELREMAYEMH